MGRPHPACKAAGWMNPVTPPGQWAAGNPACSATGTRVHTRIPGSTQRVLVPGVLGPECLARGPCLFHLLARWRGGSLGVSRALAGQEPEL